MTTTKKAFLKLQNGSDIRGVAREGPAGEEVNLTTRATCAIGQAFALRLTKKTGIRPEKCTIGVGMDSRVTGPKLKAAIAGGMLSRGVCVADCGMASTPAMFMSTVYPETSCDGACMVTASHLPFHRNGIKFFDRDGGLDREDITEILETATTLSGDIALKNFKTGSLTSNPNYTKTDLSSLYAAKLRQKIREDTGTDQPLRGLKIVVDAGNGAGGFFAADVLEKLGADTAGSLFLEPDGMFPNHAPNPEDAEAMGAIRDATRAAGADLGLIFDADVDRMSAVLPDGTPLFRDSIIAMMSAILAPRHPGSTIITDSVTSDRLTVFLEDHLGLRHLRYKRGYKNIIDKCRELNRNGQSSPLAMETSGHGCMRENYYLDDGAYLAVRLLIAVAREKESGATIGRLIADFDTECSATEARLPILCEDFHSCGDLALKKFRARAEAAGFELPESFEGVRIRFSNGPFGWALLRASLHDPVMVLNMEGKTDTDLKKIRDIARGLLEGIRELDTDPVAGSQ